MGLFGRGRKSDLALPPGMSDRLGAALTGIPMGQANRKDLISYVATGEPVRALQQLAQPAATTTFAGHVVSRDVLQGLYDSFGNVDPEVWLRWARVLEVAKGNHAWTVPLATAGLIPAWVEQ